MHRLMNIVFCKNYTSALTRNETFVVSAKHKVVLLQGNNGFGTPAHLYRRAVRPGQKRSSSAQTGVIIP